jgi:predicted membrane protein (TIGR00267 family)
MDRIWRKTIRDGVFGVQDGLVSTLGALLGIAAGTRQASIVALSGLVIVTVESLSMAAGSYLSAKSHREYLERLLEDERRSISLDPEGERRELREMYAKRGFISSEIDVIERRLFSNRDVLLEDMAHKELGICPGFLEDPASNALVMGIAYIAGGTIPVIPYLFASVGVAVWLSVSAAAIALFLTGAAKGRLVRKSWWRDGLEMVSVAAVAAIAGWLVGAAGRIPLLSSGSL